MTLEELIAKKERQLAELRKGQDNAIYLAASSTLDEVAQRIFVRGENAQGSIIGQYSTKPMIATRDMFVNKSAFKQSKIKRGKKSVPAWIRFKGRSKAVPVMFLPGGYKQFRSLNGRNTPGHVNLRLHGDLQRDFVDSLRRVGDVYLAGPKRIENVVKARAMQAKYGRIFALTPKERQLYKDTLAFEVKKIFND